MGSGLLEGAQVDGRCDPMESGASVEVLAQVCNLSRGRLVHILSWGLGGGLGGWGGGGRGVGGGGAGDG